MRTHVDAGRQVGVRRTRRALIGLLALGALTSAGMALGACAGPASPTPVPPVKPAAQPTAPPPAPKAEAQPTAAPKPAEKPTQAPPKLEVVKLKVGTPNFQFVEVPIHVALEKGFFKEQMLDVEIIIMDATATLMKAFIAKELDFGEWDSSAQISGIASGANAKLIGAVRVAHHYMVAARKEINSLKDLVGKNVAVSQPNSAPNVVLELLLRAEGIDPKSMNQVAVGGSANRARALLTGTVDATLFGVDEMDKIEADPNSKMLLLVKDVLPKYVGGAVIMHNELVARPGLAERVMESLVKATRYCFENKAPVVDMAAEKTGNPKESSAKTWDMFVQIPIWEPNGVITAEQIDYMQDVNVYLKTQDKKIAANQIIDMTHVERVIARLGKYTPKKPT